MPYPYEVTQEEYLNIPDTIKEFTDDRTDFSILMDVWGEANHAVELPVKDKDAIKLQLQTLNDICHLIYDNAKFDKGLKDELKIAEWELNDLLLGKNIYGYNKKTVMSWFNQWCYDINYDLL